MDIESLVQQPESKTLEFKRDLSSLRPILRTIVAFANTAGGILIIGCASDHSLSGVLDPFAAEEKLVNAIANNIRPSILPEIEIATIEGKHLLVVQVAHWKGPFYLKSQGLPEGVYVRLGSTSRPVNADMLAEMQRVILHGSFDQEPISELSFEALDYSHIQETFAKAGKRVDRATLRSLGLVTDYRDRLVPSVGGVILFGSTDQRMQFTPDARLSCARFQGTDKTYIIDRYETAGTILNAVGEGLNFVARNTRLAADIGPEKRTDIPEYPPLGIREALTNALVHADYTITESHPRLAIFDDRLEISNPGMLPFGYTLEDLTRGVSRVRNRVIVRTFRKLNLMEEWGSGYRRILSSCRENNSPPPTWTESALSMCVTFRPHPRTVLRETHVPYSVSTRQEEILVLLRAEGPLSTKEINRRLSVPIPDRTLRHDLAQLRKRGLVQMRGGGPTTCWIAI